MATFRCSVRARRWGRASVLIAAAVVCLACTRESSGDEPGTTEVAAIERQEIEHVAPKRDAVGPAPTRLEWTPVSGVDRYDITVTNEIDGVVLEYKDVRTTSLDWPKESKLEPGTYFWRVIGLREGRRVADSGRAAFVVAD